MKKRSTDKHFSKKTTSTITLSNKEFTEQFIGDEKESRKTYMGFINVYLVGGHDKKEF